MLTSSQIGGAVALFFLASSGDVLARPLLYSRQSTNSSLGDFGSCTLPEITFAVGFDNRKETSFEPTNLVDYNHGSADGIDIITNFMCDQLVNSCKADATAQATCKTAQAAADAQLPGTGFQADAFNAVFGIKTNFGAVDVVTDQGTTLGVDADDTATSSVSSVAAAATTAASATTSTASSCFQSAASTDSASQIGDFGSCTIPQIEFGVGFDDRTETAFQPTNQVDYNHGSADNIGVITQFMCNTLVNSCGANALAQSTCASAITAAAAATAPTGQQADAFNAVFGIQTNFAAVDVISNTGINLGPDGTGAASA
ncbi:hypothetical protein BT96DRAFT_957001 [Gymnopus androsaceus JB14]|uniref:Uncharacterized protein n=1 Tax=Gymnopus androsaceus JB14 TaxID=1447944 RepID=A0A6A4HS86_9AGAR|nr:hypothetical protein BT96DRAFT_957001 [Gymnopus androsaceus JB14]